MGIIFDERNRTFTLHTKGSTYQMQIDSLGCLLHLYYGKRINGCMDYLLTYADRGFSGNPYDAGYDRTYSLDVLPQEFPCLGTGDYRSTALIVQNADGSFGCDLRYKSHVIKKGKYALSGLPAVYAEQDEAETLEILLEDTVSGVQALLYYGVIDAGDIITRSVKITNTGEKPIFLEKVHSVCLDFLTGSYDLIQFYGRHCMERNVQRTSIAHGNQSIESRRGTSSHQYSPFMIVAEADAAEQNGNCYALSFVYSGGFKGEAEKDQFNQTRILLGLQDEMFRYPLSCQEDFLAPEVILSYTDSGLGRLSQNLHKCIRRHICRGKYKEEVRPILLNSWEASYFDFTGESICTLAGQAAEAGIELLVMDDGWFGKRDDDLSGLGDWHVNEKKLGMSLGELITRVNEKGVKFGIWVEPEMVSEDSELFREHPDWALTIPGRRPVRGRNQLVLDFSRKEVADYIFEQICGILDQGNIEYVKWDMNRSISDVYSHASKEQGKVLYDYVLGLYDFLERIVKRYPDILLEGCSGGGGRFDAGMLYYTPQIWCSDNTDAVDRVRIQYGTSFGFPVSAVGAHVSAVPNHQTGRTTSLRMRGVVAMAGTFGYELNLGDLTAGEKQEIRRQIQTYHTYAPLIQNGLYYRLSDPYRDSFGAWAFASEDKSELLLHVVMLEIHGNMTVNYVKLQGLKADSEYRDEASGKLYAGDALMEAGIPIPSEPGEYNTLELYLKEVK